MTSTCPNGHESATDDYCDQCGAPIAPGGAAAAPGGAAAAPAAAPAAVASSAGSAAPVEDELETSPAVRAEPCPQCGAPRTGDDRYCEGCGFDFAAPPADRQNGAAATWEAVAQADRAQFDRLAPDGLEFPADYAERRFPLTDAEMMIGRSRPPDQAPEINLAGKPEDPGISHLHAVLERQDDGSYALRDLGSTNGTTINDDPAPIGAEAPARLSDGDRIHIGAWTTITVRRR
jgi:FHA domain